jgi:hypothetical protein
MENNLDKYCNRSEPEILDQDMTPGDIVDILRRMRFFHHDDLRTIKLDGGVRDFLVAALQRRA